MLDLPTRHRRSDLRTLIGSVESPCSRDSSPSSSPLTEVDSSVAANRSSHHQPQAPLIERSSSNTGFCSKRLLSSPVPVLWSALAIVFTLVSWTQATPTSTVSTSLAGATLSATRLPKGATFFDLGGRKMAVFHQAFGSSGTKATIRAFDETFAKTATNSALVTFDIGHQPIVLSSGRLVMLPSGLSTPAQSLVATFYIDLTWNSGTDVYGLTGAAGGTMTGTKYFGRSITDGTFVISLKNNTRAATNEVIVYKMDASSNLANIFTSLITTTVFGSGPQAREILWYADPFILINYADTGFTNCGIGILDKTSLTVVTTVTGLRLNSIIERFRANQNIFFIANENTATGYGFTKTSISNSPVGVTELATWNTGGVDIAAMWTSPLMGIVYVQQNNLLTSVQLVNAYSLATVTTLTFTETAVRYFPVLWSSTAAREYYLTIGTAAGSNSISTKTMIWLDFCNTNGEDPCTQCQAGRYLNSASSQNLCITPEDFPKGYGINGLYMAPCLGDLAKGCIACTGTTAVCTLCDGGNGFYLEPIAGQCYLVSSIPTGFGLNTATNLVESCTVPNCLKCVANKDQCTGCSAGLFVVAGTTQPCISSLAGYGLKTVGGSTYLAPCSDGNCLMCAADWSVCTSCKAPFNLIASSATCGSISSSSSNSSQGTSCDDPRCTNCSPDFMVCKQCAATLTLADNGRCFNASSGGTVARIKLSKVSNLNTDTGDFSLLFDQQLTLVDFASRVSLQIIDEAGNIISNDKFVLSMKRSADESSVSANLQGRTEYLKAISRVSITKKNSSSIVFFNEQAYYPLDSSIVVYAVYSKTQAQTSTQIAVSSLAITASAVAVGSGAGGANAAFFIKVIDSLEYILYMNGVRIRKADDFLHYLSGDLFAFLPFSISADYETSCQPHINFFREDISCLFIENYIKNIIGLAATVCLVLLLYGLGRLSTRMIEKNRWVAFCRVYNRVMRVPAKVGSASLLLVLLEGTQVEATRYAAINLVTSNGKGWMVAGSLLSVFWLVFFGALCFCLVRFIGLIKKRMAELKLKNELPERIDQIDISGEPAVHRVVAVLFEGFRTEGDPKKTLFLWFPVASLGYNLGVQIVLVTTAGLGTPQLWGILTINVLYLSSIAVTRPFAKKYMTISYIATVSLLFLIEVCILMANYLSSRLDQSEIESVFGLLLFSLFMITLSTGLVPLVGDVVCTVRKYLASRKSSKIMSVEDISNIKSKSSKIVQRIRLTKKKLVIGKKTPSNPNEVDLEPNSPAKRKLSFLPLDLRPQELDLEQPNELFRSGITGTIRDECSSPRLKAQMSNVSGLSMSGVATREPLSRKNSGSVSPSSPLRSPLKKKLTKKLPVPITNFNNYLKKETIQDQSPKNSPDDSPISPDVSHGSLQRSSSHHKTIAMRRRGDSSPMLRPSRTIISDFNLKSIAEEEKD